MEVLGAVASSIAVLQALAAGKHVVSLIREVPDIQKDFDCLMKELNIIKSMAETVSRLTPTALEQDMINTAARNLNEITTELEELLQRCTREIDTGEKMFRKAKKRRWLLEKSEIMKLHLRMNQAKETLHFALNSSRVANDDRFQAEMRQMMISWYSMHINSSHTSLESPQLPEVENPAPDRLLNDAETTTSDTVVVNKNNEMAPKNDPIRLQSLVFAQKIAPGSSCQCRCHFFESQYRTSGWMQPLFGSWLVRYKSSSRNECSNPDCGCIRSTALRMEYQVPKWLLTRTFRILATCSSLTGLSCSLRPIRLIELTSEVWGYQAGPKQIIRRSVTTYGLYPDDTDEMGQGLIEYALSRRLYPAVEVLLDVWKNLLPEIGLHRSIAYRATDLLRNRKINDHEVYIIQKVLRFCRDESEGTTTKVHEAIRQGADTDLKQAIREQNWAINSIDETGFLPLHLAALKDQTNHVEILVSTGANVNQQMFDGRTPLMFAANEGNRESIKLLLQAKCNVNLPDYDGLSALQLALFDGNPEIVGILLAAGASPKHRDFSGDAVLHSLGKTRAISTDDLEAIINMLLIAGADLDAHDNDKNTPLMTALLFNNNAAVRALTKSGASLCVSDLFSRNLLHLAARFASFEVLQYLCGLDLFGINPYQEDDDGDTPWDDFVNTIHADEWDLSYARKPNISEQEGFTELYQGVRDQALRHDISGLEQVLSALQKQDMAMAQEHLDPLIEKEEKWGRDNIASWYRAVYKRIQNLEWDMATEDVEGCLKDLQDELDTSVWEIRSRYGYVWGDSDEDSSSEEEFQESGSSTEEDSAVEEVPAAQEQ